MFGRVMGEHLWTVPTGPRLMSKMVPLRPAPNDEARVVTSADGTDKVPGVSVRPDPRGVTPCEKEEWAPFRFTDVSRKDLRDRPASMPGTTTAVPRACTRTKIVTALDFCSHALFIP